MIARRLLLALAVIVGAAPALAESKDADPPARVGRLSHIEGTVSYHRANEDQWSAAKRNVPVTSGDSFWTEPGAKAEIQIGPAALRMDERSELDVTRLDDQATAFELRQGTVAVTLRAAPKDGVRIVTPRGEVVLWRKGSYRIDAGEATENGPADPVEVTVFDGFARVHGAKGAIELHRGESATIEGDPAEYAVGEATPAPIDDWAQARERRAVARNSGRYVPQDMTGYEDLDEHGRWESNPTYGAVWYPAAVPVGWAPYRYGHWAYVAPWGWTWIDDAPWGFAPFHYGRWALIGGVWGWCPGTFGAAPVYAPALVAFVGGSNWGISLSIGAAVGWLPLAPFEVYRPYYPASVTYVKNVNITNVNTTVINNITRGGGYKHHDVGHYQHHRYATVMGERDFAHGRNVHEAAVRVPQGRLAHAPTAERLDHVRPEADGRERTHGPAIRTADGRRDGRGDGIGRDGRSNPQGDGAASRMARIDPRAGRPEEGARNGQPRSSTGTGNESAAPRETREGTSPGPRTRQRDGRNDETGRAVRPGGDASASNDGSRPGVDGRFSRAPGSPVMRRDETHRAAPGESASGPSRGPDNSQTGTGDRTMPWPNGHRGFDNRPEQRSSNAAPGPAIRRAPSDGSHSPSLNRPDSSAPNASGPRANAPENNGPRGGSPNVQAPRHQAPGPQGAREEPAARPMPSAPVTRSPGESPGPTGASGRERMPERAAPHPGPGMQRPEARPEQPFPRSAPQSAAPSPRPSPQAMPREMTPNMAPGARAAPSHAPSIPGAPVNSAPPQAARPAMPPQQMPSAAPVMRAPQANAAPPQAAPPPPPQMPQAQQGQGERRRHGQSP